MAAYMRYWRRLKPAKTLLCLAKQRAKIQGIPFSIKEEDIICVRKCPILGIPLQYGLNKSSNASPSLDRIIPSKGYVKGNIAVMSLRANRLKSNATYQEIYNLHKWFKKQLK